MAAVNLQLLMGSTIAEPVPASVAEALVSVEVTHQDEGRSAFQLVFHVGRAGAADLIDYNFLRDPLFAPFNRVILVVTLRGTPTVLFDGIITNRQFNPGLQPGTSTFTLTGEDVSVMMDLHEKPNFFPGGHDALIVAAIIARYLQYRLIPVVIPPPYFLPKLITEQVPCKVGTDLTILKSLAQKHGYVFYVTPGPKVHTNTAYWGPPLRDSTPQRPLSYNLGSESNVDSLSFQYSALEPTMVAGVVHDKDLNIPLPVVTFRSTRRELSAHPALRSQFPNVRTSILENSEGSSWLQAFWAAQTKTDTSVEKVLTGSGELSVLRYGDILQPRGVVPLRGAGQAHDGLYYVKSVTHSLSHGEWKQKFTLTREGLGSTLKTVSV